MGILDSVKNIAGSVGNTVSKGAKSVSENSKKLAEKSKINREIKMLEADINNSYLEIGKKYFETISSAPAEEYAFDVENIIAKNQQLEEAKKALMELEDKHSCPQCGAVVYREQKFCDKCGSKLEEWTKVEVVEEVNIVEGSEAAPAPAEDTDNIVEVAPENMTEAEAETE